MQNTNALTGAIPPEYGSLDQKLLHQFRAQLTQAKANVVVGRNDWGQKGYGFDSRQLQTV